MADKNKKKYLEQGTEYRDILAYVKHYKGKVKCIPIILSGPPAVGKSMLVENLAREMGCSYFEINGTAGLTREDLEGTPAIINGNSIWKISEIEKAINDANLNGIAVLCINEYNIIRPEVQVSTNGLLDYQGRFRLTTDANRLVQIEEGNTLVIVATINEGLTGTYDIQQSVLSRIKLYIRLGYPNKKLESMILSIQSGIDPKIATIICDAGTELRRAATELDGTISRAVSTRELIAFASMIMVPDIKLEIAFDYTVVNKLADEIDEKRSILVLIDEGKDFFKKIRSEMKILNPITSIKTPIKTPKPVIHIPITPKSVKVLTAFSPKKTEVKPVIGVFDVKMFNQNKTPMKVTGNRTYKVNAIPKSVEYNGKVFAIQKNGTWNPLNLKVAKIMGNNVGLKFYTKVGTYTQKNGKERVKTIVEDTFARFEVII